MDERESPVRLDTEAARQGRVSGRVITVLIISLSLALLAMILLLGYFYPKFAWLPT